MGETGDSDRHKERQCSSRPHSDYLLLSNTLFTNYLCCSRMVLVLGCIYPILCCCCDTSSRKRDRIVCVLFLHKTIGVQLLSKESRRVMASNSSYEFVDDESFGCVVKYLLIGATVPSLSSNLIPSSDTDLWDSASCSLCRFCFLFVVVIPQKTSTYTCFIPNLFSFLPFDFFDRKSDFFSSLVFLSNHRW